MAEVLSKQRFFGGDWIRYKHQSVSTNTPMEFSVYMPGRGGDKVPALLWLSGLTCTDKNFMEKAGAQRLAAEYGMALIAPDTSPRGDDVPKAVPGTEPSWDFGEGAGFYVDATNPPFDKHYNMNSYVTRELPALLVKEQPRIDWTRVAVSGHSMGGHGALLLYFQKPGRYVSVSAFAPIANPSTVPWGIKAFSGYFGTDEAAKENWTANDSLEVIKRYSGAKVNVLVHVGTADKFAEEQLKVPSLKGVNDSVTVQVEEVDGYDHSYCTVATFLADHFAFHAAKLGVSKQDTKE